MRWKEILFEGGSGGTLDNYGPMFAPMFPNGEIPGWVTRIIKDIRRYMVTKPRIVWALRWYRVTLLQGVEKRIQLQGEIPDDDFSRLSNSVIRAVKAPSGTNVELEAKYLMNNIHRFQHWSGVPSPELKALDFGYGLPTRIVARMIEIEKKWIETRDGLIELDPDDEKLIDFGNGWVWFLLDRGSCRLEADAMGHCGNVPSERSGDRLISLRKHVTGNIWTPHLTFILHRNGYLGEMKGRGNLKPTPRYHQMITALLEDPLINGIVGGGHDPENNFDISHLMTSEQERLKNIKPGFSTFNELMDQGKTREARDMLTTKIGDRANEILRFLDHRTAVIGEYGSVDSLISDHCYDYERMFEKDILRHFENEIIMTKAGKEINGDQVYDKFHADYYYQVFRDHWHKFIEFQVGEINLVFSRELDGPVLVCLGIKEIENITDPNNDERSISDHEPLDTVSDYTNYGWSDFNSQYENYEDDITQEIVHAYFGGVKKDNIIDNIVTMIIERYVEDDRDFGHSKTQFHPDQHEFDLGDADHAYKKALKNRVIR